MTTILKKLDKVSYFPMTYFVRDKVAISDIQLDKDLGEVLRRGFVYTIKHIYKETRPGNPYFSHITYFYFELYETEGVHLVYLFQPAKEIIL